MGTDSFWASYCGAFGSNPGYSCEIRDECSDIDATVFTLGGGLSLNGHVACYTARKF
jgi:hypothetical protein